MCGLAYGAYEACGGYEAYEAYDVEFISSFHVACDPRKACFGYATLECPSVPYTVLNCLVCTLACCVNVKISTGPKFRPRSPLAPRRPAPSPRRAVARGFRLHVGVRVAASTLSPPSALHSPLRTNNRQTARSQRMRAPSGNTLRTRSLRAPPLDVRSISAGSPFDLR